MQASRCAVIALLLAPATTAAGPLNPWGSATSAGTAFVETYLYVYPDAVQILPYAGIGVTDHMDLLFGFGANLPRGGAASASLEVFPRFFFFPSLAISPHLYWTPGVDAITVAPELHANHTWKRFAFTANLGWKPVFSTKGVSAGTLALIVAPEVRLHSRFSFYLEVDPTFSLVGDPVGLVLVPGIGASLDPEARHTLSVGVQIPVLPTLGAASMGLWYAFAFPTPSER